MAATTAQTPSLRQALVPVAALLIGVALLYAGHGLQSTLVPLRAEAEGFNNVEVGLLGTFFFGGFVVGCLFGPRLILSAGHIRAFAAMVSLGSAALVMFPLVIEPFAWDVARFVIGFCLSCLYIIVESWLNEKSTNSTRGVVMSSYTILSLAMITVGQLVVTAYPLDSFALFAIASMFLSLAAVPVALTRQTAPAPVAVVRFRPWHLYRIAPAAFAGAILIGVANGAFWSLGPVFVTDGGFDTSDAAVFMSVAVAAGALAQYPLGRASDFIDRRKILILAMMGAVASGLLLWQLSGLGQGALLACAALFGAFTLPAYSLAAAHAFDWAQPEEMVETSATFVLLFGIGSAAGPILAPFLMRALDGAALFLFTALVHGILLGFVLWRIMRRTAPSAEEKGEFDIFSTAPTGAALTPEPVDPEMPMIEVPDWPQPADEDGEGEGAGEGAGTAGAARDAVHASGARLLSDDPDGPEEAPRASAA